MFYERIDRRLRPGETAAAGPPTTLSEVYAAELEAVRFAYSTNSKQRASEQAYDARIDTIKAATGIALENPWRLSDRALRGRSELGDSDESGDRWTFFDKQVDELAVQFPNKVRRIKPPASVQDEARGRARNTEAASAEIYARAGSGRMLASLAAGFRGGLEDPVNLASLAFGPFGKVGQGAKAVLWNGVKTGAVNAGAEVAAQPIIQSWRAEAGLEHGLSQAALNVTAAFGLGFGLDAGVRGAYRGLKNLGGKISPAVSENFRAQNAASADPAAALDAAAAARPEGDPIRAAADGDVTALKALVQATGAADDPAVKGALTALDLEGDLDYRLAGVSGFDRDQRLIQALRAADDPDEPPPLRPDLTPEARTPALADDVALPKAIHGNQHARRFEIEGKLVTYRALDPGKIETDAAVFQFKGGGDASGGTGRLSGVERWDPIAAGRSVVYERADGQQIIADGHQRLSLAKRLADQQPELPAFVFRQADGWTVGDVRALAAKKNLQEGSGSVLDAAKIIRERPDIIDASVPLGSDALRQARALARLSDDGFAAVAGGVVPANQAVLVADLVADPGRHAGILDELARAAPDNARQARFLIGDILAADSHTETQMTLLGGFTSERSLLPERSQVLDQALQTLRKDARVFSVLQRDAARIERAGNRLAADANAQAQIQAETVSAVIEQLAATRGPVSDWLSDAARALAAGQPKTLLADAFARRVADALQRDGLRGLSELRPQSLRTEAIDDVGGADGRAQVTALEREFAGEIADARKPEQLAARQKVLFQLRHDTLAKRFEATAIEEIGMRAQHPGKVLAFHGTKADFNSFDKTKSKDFGVHLGTASQANHIIRRGQTPFARFFSKSYHEDARVLPVILDVKNPLVLPDLGNWRPLDMLTAIEKAGVRIDLTDRANIRRMADSGRRRTAYNMIEGVLNKAGYDAIRYRNGAEGFGWSYITWNAGTVKSATTDAILFDIRDPATYRATWRGQQSNAEIRQELNRTIAMLPPDVQLRVVDRLTFQGQSPGGLYDGADKIVYVAMTADDPVRTARHEVVHALRQTGLMTDDEFQRLTAFADQMDLRKAYSIDKTYKQVYTQAYGHEGDAVVEALLREETIAEMFADYSLNGRRFGAQGGGFIDQLFAMLVRFFKELRDGLHGLGFRGVTDIFEAIETGEMAARRVYAAVRNDQGKLAMIAGERATTADHAKLKQANDLEGAGKSREEIWKKTGWYRGVDRKWRFEIDDSTLRSTLPGIGLNIGTVEDLFAHPELFGSYPAIATARSAIEWVARAVNAEGSQTPNFIWVKASDEVDVRSVGAHEMQHLLQDVETFAKGSSPGMSNRWFAKIPLARQKILHDASDLVRLISDLRADGRSVTAAQLAAALDHKWFDGRSITDDVIALADAPARLAGELEKLNLSFGSIAYERTAGEVEARTVAKRIDMTPEQRRARPPWLDYDVPESQQLIRFSDSEKVSLQSNLEEADRAGDMKTMAEACKL